MGEGPGVMAAPSLRQVGSDGKSQPGTGRPRPVTDRRREGTVSEQNDDDSDGGDDDARPGCDDAIPLPFRSGDHPPLFEGR